MIKVVDYGLGNIGAFLNVYKRLNIPCESVDSVENLTGTTKIILPGVGSFDHAMALLTKSGMREMLENLVCVEKVPLLGICVGMQMLANSSDEGLAKGLGWIPGNVTGFKSVDGSANLPLPHMGWNDVTPTLKNGLFEGLGRDARFYFLHSYFFSCERQSNVLASSSYGIDFSCAIQSDNVYGVQFHPEKSHHYGALLLKNFAEL